MSDVLYICIEILKLLANLFCFIFFIEGDEIKENYFSYQAHEQIFRIFCEAKTID